MLNERIVDLRPHHGLCLGFFEGYGYSDGFSRSMAAVLKGLEVDSVVKLAEGHDCICINCPNRVTACPNAAVYDRRILQLCGLRTGQELTWSAFQRKIRECVLDSGRLAEVCGNCKWASICENKEYND